MQSNCPMTAKLVLAGATVPNQTQLFQSSAGLAFVTYVSRPIRVWTCRGFFRRILMRGWEAQAVHMYPCVRIPTFFASWFWSSSPKGEQALIKTSGCIHHQLHTPSGSLKVVKKILCVLILPSP